MSEYIFEINDALYDEETGMACFQPKLKSKLIRCKNCIHSIDYYMDGDCYCRKEKNNMRWISGGWNFYCADGKEKLTD